METRQDKYNSRERKRGSCGCLVSVFVMFFVLAIIGVIVGVAVGDEKGAPEKVEISSEQSIEKEVNVFDKAKLSKEEFGEIDEAVWERVVYVIDAQNNLMNAMEQYADFQISELDFFNYCKETHDYCQNIWMDFPTSKNEDAKSYIKSCKDYIVCVQVTAKSIEKYLDDKTNSNLSEVQDNIARMNRAIQIVASNRGTYLVLAGYSQEEIEELVKALDEEISGKNKETYETDELVEDESVAEIESMEELESEEKEEQSAKKEVPQNTVQQPPVEAEQEPIMEEEIVYFNDINPGTPVDRTAFSNY